MGGEEMGGEEMGGEEMGGEVRSRVEGRDSHKEFQEIIHAHMHAHACTHAHMHTHTCTHTHACMHTHTHTIPLSVGYSNGDRTQHQFNLCLTGE